MGTVLKAMVLVGGVALVAGCATNSGVVSIGGGNFLLSRQAATGFGGMGNLKARTLQEASHYCEAKGLNLRLIGSEESKPPYVLGNYPRAEITFACDPK